MSSATAYISTYLLNQAVNQLPNSHGLQYPEQIFLQKKKKGRKERNQPPIEKIPALLMRTWRGAMRAFQA